MHRVHIPDLPWEEKRSPTGRFHSLFRNLSLALGGIRNGGTWCGGHPFDLQIRRVPRGASICPYHLHLAQWEMFIVHDGAGTVRSPDGRTPVSRGDVFFHPPGSPHQLTADADADLEVLIITDNPPLDGCYYPDSDKWALRPPGKVFRLTEVDYYLDEEPVVSGATPYRVSAAPASPEVAPFAKRRVNIDALAWEDWGSPKRTFRGASKELSIALGAKRNTPTGLGGHPFDLELQKLLPGERSAPFHSHAAQWELFFILRGEGTVRLRDVQLAVRAGDVVLHPPGEAHTIANTGNTDLLFYIVADNPPIDFCEYPDSAKWGFLRHPRKFFRPTDVEYWDGEE